jgi:hypothetical protein
MSMMDTLQAVLRAETHGIDPEEVPAGPELVSRPGSSVRGVVR